MENYLNSPKYLIPLPNEELAEGNFTTLTDMDTIKNFAVAICNALYHPVTIIDINRFKDDKNFKFVTINSDVNRFSLREACRLFRHCAGDDICNRCYSYHAEIFINTTRKSFEEDIKEIEECINEVVNNRLSFFYDGYISKPPKVLTYYDRPIVEYFCPILGYRELIFPIYYKNKIIGVLSTGQSMISATDDKKIIEQIQSDFFTKSENKPEYIFNSFLEKNNLKIKEAEKIKEAILDITNSNELTSSYFYYENIDGYSVRPQNFTFNTIEEYYAFIESACKKICEMEYDISIRVLEKQKKFFEKTLNKVMSNYHHKLEEYNRNRTTKEQHKQQRENLENACNSFEQFANELKIELDFEEVLIFGDGIRLEIKEQNLKPLYPLSIKDKQYFNLKYDFSVTKGKVSDGNDIISSLMYPDILNGFNIEIDLNNVILLSFHNNIAVLLRVKNLNEYIELYNEMVLIIGKSFSRIQSHIALCAANYMKEHHLLTLRMNRHEGANVSNLLSDQMRIYFSSDGSTFINLPSDKREDIINDVKNSAQLIANMAENIGLIIGTTNIDIVNSKIGRTDIFDSLFKWRVMFRKNLRDRNLDIIIPRVLHESIPYFISNNCKRQTKKRDDKKTSRVKVGFYGYLESRITSAAHGNERGFCHSTVENRLICSM